MEEEAAASPALKAEMLEPSCFGGFSSEGVKGIRINLQAVYRGNRSVFGKLTSAAVDLRLYDFC